MARSADRAKFAQGTRLTLVESDIDTLEAGQQKLVDAIDGLRKVMLGILASISTACILLVINVTVMRGR
jgi:hypothetical protein